MPSAGKNSLRPWLCWIWEQPQTLIGFVGRLIFRSCARERTEGTTSVFVPGNWGAMSLGPTIFLGDPGVPDWKARTLAHERGHSEQSFVLGPLYLVVVGLPSLLWAFWHRRWGRKFKVPYGWFYTEAWADRLGGQSRVDRGRR